MEDMFYKGRVADRTELSIGDNLGLSRQMLVEAKAEGLQLKATKGEFSNCS